VLETLLSTCRGQRVKDRARPPSRESPERGTGAGRSLLLLGARAGKGEQQRNSEAKAWPPQTCWLLVSHRARK